MKIKRKLIRLGLFIFLLFIFQSHNAQQLAFPGAEGFGKYAKGGRGGIVIEVTNLNDSGTGSLRNAITSYKGKKRTIVFRVSGTIELKSTIEIKYDSCITIAGQTAPGDGICIKDFPIKVGDSHDIIFRYIRFRIGDEQDCGTGCDDIDALSIRKSYNIIVDHCSLGWSIDAVLDLTVTTGYSTVQWCLLHEPLNNSKHSKGSHCYIAGWDGSSYGGGNVFGGGSYHHNLLASGGSRTPRLDKYAGDNGERDLIDIVNNVIYNWSGYGAYGGESADVNWQNNYYKYGPNTTSRRSQIFLPGDTCRMYVNGNYVDGYPSVTADNSKGISIESSALAKDEILQDKPYELWFIDMQPSADAYKTVLVQAGAFLPERDAVDSRIVNDVKNGTGDIIDSQAEVGGWPELTSETAPVDTDKDGMPDDWEDTHNLDKNNAGDRNTIASNGYTMLEVYLNSIEFNNTVENINFSFVEDGKIKITWDDSFIGEDSFIIERAENGTDFEIIVSVSKNIDEYIDSTYQQYDNIKYRVIAFQEDSFYSPIPDEFIMTGMELVTDDIIHVGDTVMIGVSITPDSATNRLLNWELRIEDTDKASINQGGRLIAINEGTIEVSATTIDGSNITATKQITIEKAVSINEYRPIESLEEKIKCFPNPSPNGYFNIKLPYSLKSENIFLIVTDLLGNTIYSIDFTGENSVITIEYKFNKGIYFLHLPIKRKIITQKLVVTN